MIVLIFHRDDLRMMNFCGPGFSSVHVSVERKMIGRENESENGKTRNSDPHENCVEDGGGRCCNVGFDRGGNYFGFLGGCRLVRHVGNESDVGAHPAI